MGIGRGDASAMTPSAHPYLSIAAPCFNEEEVIGSFYQQLTAVVSGLGCSYEIILVDDGSTDRTPAILAEMASADATLSVLALTRNFGHQVALTAALDHAQGDVVVMLDSDLQHPPALIPAMLALCHQGYDVVYAVRKSAEAVGLMKRLEAALYYAMFNRLSGVQITPGAADFRLMTRRALDALNGMREQHRFLRGMVPWLGFPSAHITFDAPARPAGSSKYTLVKMLGLGLRGIVSFSTLPLQVITLLGVAATSLACLYFGYVLARWLIIGDLALGWGSLMSVVLLLGGLQLISMGVIALYTGLILEEVKQRPLYVLKQKIVGGRVHVDEGVLVG